MLFRKTEIMTPFWYTLPYFLITYFSFCSSKIQPPCPTQPREFLAPSNYTKAFCDMLLNLPSFYHSKYVHVINHFTEKISQQHFFPWLGHCANTRKKLPHKKQEKNYGTPSSTLKIKLSTIKTQYLRQTNNQNKI